MRPTPPRISITSSSPEGSKPEHVQADELVGLGEQRAGNARHRRGDGVDQHSRRYTGAPMACMRVAFSRMPVSIAPNGE